MQFTLEVDEANGSVMVSMDGGEPQQVETLDEALDWIRSQAGGEPMEDEGAEEGMDPAAMWDEEAKKRPAQSNLMM